MSAPIFTKEHFANWVRQQDPDKEYWYWHCDDCAFAQYLKAMGFKRVTVGKRYFKADDKKYNLADGIDDAVRPNSSFGYSGGTFGALAERLA